MCTVKIHISLISYNILTFKVVRSTGDDEAFKNDIARFGGGRFGTDDSAIKAKRVVTHQDGLLGEIEWCYVNLLVVFYGYEWQC
jgi:hypothetical protein